jgi:hypothetical protein
VVHAVSKGRGERGEGRYLQSPAEQCRAGLGGVRGPRRAGRLPATARCSRGSPRRGSVR